MRFCASKHSSGLMYVKTTSMPCPHLDPQTNVCVCLLERKWNSEAMKVEGDPMARLQIRVTQDTCRNTKRPEQVPGDK